MTALGRFTSPCAQAEAITFNFQYENYVTAIAADALDPSTETYQQFHDFIAKAQAVNYKNANNQLDTILDGTVSDPPAKADVFDVEITEYPAVTGVTSKKPAPRPASRRRRLIPA